MRLQHAHWLFFSSELKEQTNLPRRAIHVLKTIDECMTERVDNCTTLSDRWTNIGNKVYELGSLISRCNTNGASRAAREALSEWAEVETSLEQYETLVEELVRNSPLKCNE